MASFYFVLPGPPETPTGGFAYDKHMLRALRSAGRLAGSLVLPGAYPRVGAIARAAAERQLQTVPDRASLIVDGLALAPLLEVFADMAQRVSLYALIHHPLCDEAGLHPDIRQRLFERERSALALAWGIVVTSAHTALRLGDFGVPAERVRIVRPGSGGRPGGTRPMPISNHDEAPVLLCVASLTPRKGQDVLLRALAGVRRFGWRLLLVGPARDPAFAARLRRFARQLGLDERVTFTGVVSEATLARLYAAADLFVLPTRYEGYGIAVAEAAGFGLPVLACDAGGVGEAITAARHRLVPAGNVAALAAALRSFLTLGCGRGWRAPTDVQRRSWQAAGREFVAALDAIGTR